MQGFLWSGLLRQLNGESISGSCGGLGIVSISLREHFMRIGGVLVRGI